MSLIDILDTPRENPTRSRRIAGVVPAIVTDNRDSAGLGRVKVSFPWLSNENESGWAKVMSFMAGDNRGGFFLPEVGDEVLVSFEQGDINYPYVIGALWNSVHLPPSSNEDGNNNIRKITSRSGHEIIFYDDDRGGEEKLEVHSKAGHRITLDDSSGSAKIAIVDKTGSNTIVIDSVQNTITIESAANLAVKAKVVSIEASAAMELKSRGELTLQGALIRIN
jgi:uncharacterized protein involved in type VI secretion and phage assembly